MPSVVAPRKKELGTSIKPDGSTVPVTLLCCCGNVALSGLILLFYAPPNLMWHANHLLAHQLVQATWCFVHSTQIEVIDADIVQIKP